MRDIPALLQPMKDRLTAATEAAPVPWQAVGTGAQGGDHWYVCAEDESIASIACHDGQNEEQREPLARLFAAAPTDQAKLIAAIDAVESLASRTVNAPIEYSAGYLAKDILAALTQALGGDGA